MRRFGWGALLLLLLPPPAAADVVGYLAEYADVVECPNDVVLLQTEKPKDLHIGDAIVTRDVTKDPTNLHGTARAFLQDSQTILIGGNTKLLIGGIDTPDGMRSTGIRLDEGRIRLFAREGTACRVDTPAGVVECRGTDFIVVVDPRTGETIVFVISGAVEVRGVGAASASRLTVHAYELTRIAPGQAPSQPTVPDETAVNQFTGDLEVVGQATSERLPFGRELVAGTRVLVTDQPDLGARLNPWGPEYMQEQPGTLGSPLFGVPGALQVDY